MMGKSGACRSAVGGAFHAAAPSFNGRTADSGSAYRGSNPWGAAKFSAAARALILLFVLFFLALFLLFELFALLREGLARRIGALVHAVNRVIEHELVFLQFAGELGVGRDLFLQPAQLQLELGIGFHQFFKSLAYVIVVAEVLV